MKHILFYGGCGHFGQVTQNNLMNTPSHSPVISEEKMLDRYVAVQMSGLGYKVTSQLDILYLYKTVVSLG